MVAASTAAGQTEHRSEVSSSSIAAWIGAVPAPGNYQSLVWDLVGPSGLLVAQNGQKCATIVGRAMHTLETGRENSHMAGEVHGFLNEAKLGHQHNESSIAQAEAQHRRKEVARPRSLADNNSAVPLPVEKNNGPAKNVCQAKYVYLSQSMRLRTTSRWSILWVSFLYNEGPLLICDKVTNDSFVTR